MTQLSREERVALARQYVEQLEKDQDADAGKTLWQLVEVDGALFQGVGQLTRELHDSLVEISDLVNDPRMGEITHHELPDAEERLAYVIKMTEDAANTTLNSLDVMGPGLEYIRVEGAELGREWQRFRSREMNVGDFRALTQRLTGFLEGLEQKNDAIQAGMSEILMAQSYQDLTGQIVKRVSRLVHDVEQKLVQLLRIAHTGLLPAVLPVTEKPPEVEEDTGPLVPGVNDQGRVHGQDEVDDLLSELGF
jgi:chemotaxis protein CheZ